MLIKQEFQIDDKLMVTFERTRNQLNEVIKDCNDDTLIIKNGKQVIVLNDEKAHEFLKICRDTKFIFTDGNQ